MKRYKSQVQSTCEDCDQRLCRAQSLVRTLLEASWKGFFEAALLGEDVLASLFIRNNTTMSSSAAAGCMFSLGRDRQRAKRAALSDSNFERLMFLKRNMHHKDSIEGQLDVKNDWKYKYKRFPTLAVMD